jgi:hypothetical protein
LPEAELGRVRQGPSVNAARLPAAFPLGQCGRRLCRGSQLYQEGGDEISASAECCGRDAEGLQDRRDQVASFFQGARG